MIDLANRAVLITGGGSGIGLATARQFLAAGAQVAISGRDEAKLGKAAAGLATGGHVLAHPTDVTDPGQVQNLVRRVTESFGRIDILVNNAGANVKARAFKDLTPETWDYLVRVNLDGAFYCMHAVLPQMIGRKDGLIVNISSVAGLRSNPISGAGYSAAKFGMTALGICAAVELREHNIRVTNICPGEVDTPIMEFRPKPPTEQERALILQPDDVAAAVLFVASLPTRAHVPELVIKPTAQFFL